MMKGQVPILPHVSVGVVDVQDVAVAHVQAMRVKEAAGPATSVKMS